MCDKETGELLKVEPECRYVGLFLNLGLIQGGWDMDEPRIELCSECVPLLEEIKEWVFENPDVFSSLDEEIASANPKKFLTELWPIFFEEIIQDEVSEGRLFALLVCLTRAGMIWKQKKVELEEISYIQGELQQWVKQRLPRYDWRLFSQFLDRIRADREGRILKFLWKTVSALEVAAKLYTSLA